MECVLLNAHLLSVLWICVSQKCPVYHLFMYLSLAGGGGGSEGLGDLGTVLDILNIYVVILTEIKAKPT